MCWQIDSNTDGLVDFTEFVAATLHVHQLEEHDSDKWQNRSQAAFEKFDLDKDGFITPEELRMVGLMFFLNLPEHYDYCIFYVILMGGVFEHCCTSFVYICMIMFSTSDTNLLQLISLSFWFFSILVWEAPLIHCLRKQTSTKMEKSAYQNFGDF